MNAEPRLWWSLFDENVEAARQRKVLRAASTADDLIPAERLDFLASVTTTQYIQLGRTRGTALPLPSEPEAGIGSTPPTSPASGISAPHTEGETHGEYTYHKCSSCGQMKPYKKWWPKAKCWDCFKETKS